ncbi:MAG: tetratricopeptide repeat protein [Actinobacteria bacterium]|nr:tetratricopeptide repeat protein [Actinomycetota bacterium]
MKSIFEDEDSFPQISVVTMHLMMASIHEAEGKAEAAIVEYSEVCEYDPEIFQVYVNRGTLYIRLQQFKRAIRDFERASTLEPGVASTYVKLGDAYLAVNETKLAEAAYLKCLDLAPANATAMARLESLRRSQLGLEALRVTAA